MSDRSAGNRGISAHIAMIACGVVLLGGCRDSGLPGKNLPHEQARTAQWSYPIYEATRAATQLYEVEGVRWQASGLTESVPQHLLRPVGGAGATQMMAVRWDEAPYDRLYSAAEGGRYTVMVPLDLRGASADGASHAAPASDTTHAAPGATPAPAPAAAASHDGH